MSKLTPISCELKPNHGEIIAQLRPMKREHMDFLDEKFKDLEIPGIAKPSKNPTFSSVCFAVPKKEKGKYRMVADLRILNNATVKTGLLMPNLEEQLTYISGSKLYGSLDILSGFDFLPVEEDSQKYFTMVTPTSAWTMRGAPMGWSNTPALFSNRIMTEIVKPSNLYAIHYMFQGIVLGI